MSGKNTKSNKKSVKKVEEKQTQKEELETHKSKMISKVKKSKKNTEEKQGENNNVEEQTQKEEVETPKFKNIPKVKKSKKNKEEKQDENNNDNDNEEIIKELPSKEELLEKLGQIKNARDFIRLTLPQIKLLIPVEDDSKRLNHFLRAARSLHESHPTSTNRSKVLTVERRLRALIEAGQVTRKRRVPNTGKVEQITLVYKDTPENQAKNRVGQSYTRTRYVDCEYEDVKVERLIRKKNKRQRELGEDGEPVAKRTSTPWIRGLNRAREELGLKNKFIPAYKEKPDIDCNDEKKKIGHELYLLATKYQQEIKDQEQNNNNPIVTN